MATVTRKRPRPQAAPGVCRWLVRPVAAASTEVGVLGINGAEYVVTVCRDGGAVQGARLTKPDRTVYHTDLTTGACDCPDHAYRGRQCKHHRGVVAALAVLGVKGGAA